MTEKSTNPRVKLTCQCLGKPRHGPSKFDTRVSWFLSHHLTIEVDSISLCSQFTNVFNASHLVLWRLHSSIMARLRGFTLRSCWRLRCVLLWRNGANVLRDVTLDHEIRPKDTLTLFICSMWRDGIKPLNPKCFPSFSVLSWMSTAFQNDYF